MKTVLPLTCCASLLLLSTGCETPTPQPHPQKTISCKLPVVTPLDETKILQEKGGIQISVVPASYQAERGSTTNQLRVEPNFGEALLTQKDPRTGQPYPFVEQRVEPFLRTSPDRLAFLIKINNKLPRVFRGAGTVVQFNVAGKVWDVDQTGYGEMLSAIIPPRTEKQLQVTGPKLSDLPDQGTIGLFFYDVVIATDAAGRITEKQNFEWFFNYAVKQVDETGEVHVSRGQVIPR